jgi:hypothetical protein
MSPFEWLRFADTIAMAICAAKLLASGLFRLYPLLFALLSAAALTSSASAVWNMNSQAYLYSFAADSIIRWILLVATVASLSRKVLSPYSALAAISRWSLVIAIIAALTSTIATVPLAAEHYTFRGVLLPIILRLEQCLTAAMAAFLLCLCALLGWFTVPVCRNLQRIFWCLVIVFVTRSATSLLAVVFGPTVFPILNPILLACTTATFLFLAWKLNPQGESVVTYLGRTPPPLLDAQIRLLSHLGKHTTSANKGWSFLVVIRKIQQSFP